MYSNTQTPKQSRVNINEHAPQIIGEVAHELLAHRPHFETDKEIRFGTKGSFSVDKVKGTYNNHEEDKGGGLLDMICHLEGYTSNNEAMRWLQAKGFLNNSYISQPRTHRPPPRAPKPINTEMLPVSYTHLTLPTIYSV